MMEQLLQPNALLTVVPLMGASRLFEMACLKNLPIFELGSRKSQLMSRKKCRRDRRR